MNEGWSVIEKYQYAEYRRTHSNNWVAWVWVFALTVCATLALFALVR